MSGVDSPQPQNNPAEDAPHVKELAKFLQWLTGSDKFTPHTHHVFRVRHFTNELFIETTGGLIGAEQMFYNFISGGGNPKQWRRIVVTCLPRGAMRNLVELYFRTSGLRLDVPNVITIPVASHHYRQFGNSYELVREVRHMLQIHTHQMNYARIQGFHLLTNVPGVAMGGELWPRRYPILHIGITLIRPGHPRYHDQPGTHPAVLASQEGRAEQEEGDENLASEEPPSEAD